MLPDANNFHRPRFLIQTGRVIVRLAFTSPMQPTLGGLIAPPLCLLGVTVMATDPKPEHFVLSDLHLGHTNILNFCRPWFKSIEEHDAYIINQINITCTENDYLWLLGDVAFNREAIMSLKKCRPKLALIAGNHDNFSADTYLRVFEQIRGVAQMGQHANSSNNAWGPVLFSHIPMHPDQMRWGKNVHGHLHTYHTDDPLDRYINVSCEPLAFTPARISDILTRPQEFREVIPKETKL